ncbi:hypothetical protein [Paenibacillus sp. NPDC057934]|uniref:hypothetical protein n=1 Tax=Paenibacillus sp. NPDC057934 TaxID=3346282 RepID=UPI0036DA5AD5
MKRTSINKFRNLIIFVGVVLILLIPIQTILAEENEIVPIETFESGTFKGSNYIAASGVITNNPSQVVSGLFSVNLISQQTDEWKEAIYTDQQKVKFEKNTTYSVTFSYKSLDMNADNNRYFYFLARSNDGQEDKGMTIWKESAGNSGIKTVTFKTGTKDNYFLIWGIHGGGSYSIDDIRIVKSVPKTSETFENGSFNGTNYLPGSGSITNDPSKIVNGSYSAYLSSLLSEDWKEFSYSDNKKIKFEKNTTYSVTFSYKSVSMDKNAQNRFFYFLARSTDVKDDQGWTVWNDSSGSVGSKTITFTTGNKDNYYLIWGIHAGGALSIDDIQVNKLSESFENGTYNNTNFLPVSGTITNDPDKVVSGAYSAFLNASKTEEWKEFSYTDPAKVKFEKNTTYTISFAFKSESGALSDPNQFFYFLARSTDNKEDKGWTKWGNSGGRKGTQTVTFTTGNKDNYYLIWGIHAGGTLSLDDIRIIKSGESFEKGTFSSTKYTPLLANITNDPTKVISGTHSAYAASSSSQEWADFLFSDSSKMVFEKNTAYSITFSYKVFDMNVSDKNRYFYFLGRSGDNLEEIANIIWSDNNGSVGSKTVSFTTGDKENYYIYWGANGGGALSLDDIIVKQLETYEYDSNGRLMQRRLSDNRVIKYLYDKNGNLIKTRIE